MNRTLHIFLTNGSILKFSKVTGLVPISNTKLITFNYVSDSDNVSREAVFDVEAIAGYSTSDELEETQESMLYKYLKGDK